MKMPGTPEPKKQAVIVVHGMGEQRPMQTLRGFVSGLLSPDSAPGTGKKLSIRSVLRTAADSLAPPQKRDKDKENYWIVPDARTGSSELSRIRTKPMPINTGSLETDFYELYYSDLLTGNTLQQLGDWFRGLLLRWPHQVPKSQALMWCLLWAATVVIAILVGSELANSPLKRLQDSWESAGPLPDGSKWPIFASLLGAALLMWLLSALYRRHVDSKNTKPGDGVIHRYFSAALCILLPALIGIWAYFSFPWSIFLIPQPLLDAMKGKSLLYQAWLLIKGWSLFKMALAALIAFLAVKMGVPVFGDVARYVRSAPDGVAARGQIRERGLKLLEAVHDAKVLAPGVRGEPAAREYARVVIVAHSLGSIVAYDVLRMFWAKRGANGGKPLSAEAAAAIEMVDKFCRKHPAGPGENANWPLEEYIELQSEAAAAVARQAQGDGWRVSDFVTLGSPLAHAEFLLARDRPRFERLIGERVFPTSPPQLDSGTDTESGGSFLYTSAIDGNKWPHHASLFAVTRWTAVYDPARLIFGGDFIGGNLRRNFGPGIAEARAKLTKPGLLKRLVTHTHYWNPMADCQILSKEALPVDIRPGASAKQHLSLLRKIIFREPRAAAGQGVKSPSGPAPARPGQARSQGRGSQRAGKTSRPS
jgi:hypothetical protein